MGRLRGLIRCVGGAALVAGLGAGGPALAQAANAAPVADVKAPAAGVNDETAPMTLHAYTNLVQVPVLVLGAQRQHLPPVDPGLFVMSLNSGRPFRPVHVRAEGDDPISLAILVDGNARRNSLLAAVPDGVASLLAGPLARGSLHPQDHVMVYVLDCGRIRYATSLPREPGQIGQAVEALMTHRPLAEGARQDEAACKAPTYLWNSMAFVARELSVLPGRRVLLAVTDGRDNSGAVRWTTLRDFATRESITIFAMSKPVERPAYFVEPQDDMATLCEFSGGMRMWSSPKQLPEAMADLVRTLRERYILDFPRPNKAPVGEVWLAVTLYKRPAFIRSSGVSFPLSDPKVLSDPNTVPSDPTRAPEIGARRILKSP